MPPTIVVTGLGFATCIGNSKQSVCHSLRELEGGIRAHAFLGNETLSAKTIGRPPEFEVEGANWRLWRLPERYGFDSSLLRALSPHGVYATCALIDALADARLERGELSDGETGLYCASAGSPLMLFENLAHLRQTRGERGNPMGVLASIAGTLNFNLGSWLGIRGSNCGYTSACASSSHAIGYAFDDLALGRQSRAIIVAGEDATAESLLPFAAMRALSTNPDPMSASRPFDRDRDGFVGAGGGIALILETLESAKARQAHIYAELRSWAQSSDGYHRASPHPEGAGLSSAIGKALRYADIEASQLDYICAHATSTPAGDKAEAIAIAAALGDAAAKVPVSSVKGLAGHSLSMAGALEAAVCCLAIDEGFIPGNANLANVAPECAHLQLPLSSLALQPTWVLNNSSGFGGSNVCHIFRRP